MNLTKRKRPMRESVNLTLTSGEQADGAVCGQRAETWSGLIKADGAAIYQHNKDIQVIHL
ncbi:hypothetical protein [Rhizobium sp. PDO1-076]|uniref:hypothetical protein n=1 Tax=Rhizobium sp. PDO1-076 TaxID=1125979 RepID=UPI00114672F9|nr:hypothetical protein [Rhizobium sp. PDO1-076]